MINDEPDWKVVNEYHQIKRDHRWELALFLNERTPELTVFFKKVPSTYTLKRFNIINKSYVFQLCHKGHNWSMIF